MEGIIFLGFAWGIWIIATFFWSKTVYDRFKISFCVLITIILSPYEFHLLGFQLNMAATFLYIYLYFEVVRLKRKTGLYLFLSSFIMMLGYVSFLLLELYDPVWVIFDRKWMIASILVYLCLLLQSEKKLRFYTILMGTLQGEFVFSVILKRFTIDYLIGTYTFFDAIGATLTLLSVWTLLEIVTVYLDHQTNHFGKGKQKSS